MYYRLSVTKIEITSQLIDVIVFEYHFIEIIYDTHEITRHPQDQAAFGRATSMYLCFNNPTDSTSGRILPDMEVVGLSRSQYLF